MFDFKFGIQQDKKDSNQLLEAIIEGLCSFYFVLTSQSCILSKTLNLLSKTLQIIIQLEYAQIIAFLSDLSVIWIMKDKSLLKKQRRKLNNLESIIWKCQAKKILIIISTTFSVQYLWNILRVSKRNFQIQYRQQNQLGLNLFLIQTE